MLIFFQETDLSKALEALRVQDGICDVLSIPTPSATGIVNAGEKIMSQLHQWFVHLQVPQPRPDASKLVHLMTNITQQVEEYQPEESDIGPALHAARQVAYWSSVFVSMMSDNPISFPVTASNHHATSSITTATITS